jgi:hypothetical protein
MESQIQNIQQIQYITTDIATNFKGLGHPDEPERFKLTIRFSEHYRYITNVWIFDDTFTLIVSPSDEKNYLHEREYVLPSTGYIVRIENNRQIRDNLINLDKNLIVSVGEQNTSLVKLQLPLLYSSAPISGPIHYASSDWAYVDAAERISGNRLLLNDANSNSGIFFFFRYPSVSLYRNNFCQKQYWHRFQLLDDQGNVMLRFPEHCEVSERDGYLGVCMALKSGNYYLQYKKRNHARMVPLYVYENWYTQFFMTLADEPLFGSIRYFINRSSIFDSADYRNSYVDICLDKLQNNDFTIDPNLLRNISYGKFESPMLGLVGAFLYFSSKESKDDELFNLILHNLQTRILHNEGDSPDIMALKILAMEHSGKNVKIDKTPHYSRTPTLRIALDTIRRNANKFPWLVNEGGITDYIIEKQVFDSPFNTFRPLSSAILRKASQIEDQYNDPFRLDSKNDQLSYKIAYRKIRLEEEIMLNPDKKYILETAGEAEPKQMTLLAAFRKHGSAGAAIFEKLSQTSNESTAEIAKTLNLPEVTVERIRRGLKL